MELISKGECMFMTSNEEIIKSISNGEIPKGFIGIDEMVANCLKEKNRTSCKDCQDECMI